MDNKARLLQTVPTMNGWCDPAKANHVYDTVFNQNARLCVELGVFAGRSLIAFGLAQDKRRTSDPKTPRKTYGIDTWAATPAVENNNKANSEWWLTIDYDAIKRECNTTLSTLGISDLVEVVQSSTVQAFYDLDLHDIDVLHIDGNHSRWDSVRDVTLWVDRVRTGGIVYFDDEDWESTKNAQELLLEKCERIGEIKTTNVCGVYRKRAGGLKSN